jgi:hypothetical protein
MKEVCGASQLELPIGLAPVNAKYCGMHERSTLWKIGNDRCHALFPPLVTDH